MIAASTSSRRVRHDDTLADTLDDADSRNGRTALRLL